MSDGNRWVVTYRSDDHGSGTAIFDHYQVAADFVKSTVDSCTRINLELRTGTELADLLP